MNMVYEAVTKHNISLDTLWDIAKKYRLDYIYWKLDDKVPYCAEDAYTFYTAGFIEDDLFDYFSSDLKILFSLEDQPIYEVIKNDSLLSEGFHLFHYGIRCIPMYKNSLENFQTTLKTFKNGSTIQILETANEIRKGLTKKRRKLG